MFENHALQSTLHRENANAEIISSLKRMLRKLRPASFELQVQDGSE